MGSSSGVPWQLRETPGAAAALRCQQEQAAVAVVTRVELLPAAATQGEKAERRRFW
jgi:hypothetical protein